jgi:Type I phosphodiesterase / nucleotide pyrophosphatase
LDGGDRDEVALIGHHANVISNDRFFTLPSYLVDFPTLEDRIDELDKRDGEADGLWLGHEISASHDNPAWVALQTDMIEAMFERSGYGADDIPDVFLTNFKASDLVGHRYTIDSEEMRQVIEAQDKALGDLVELLDDKVGDYVMVISADHGHTPSSKRTGAWAMGKEELENDIDAHFDVPEGRSLSQCCSVGGIFLDPAVKSEIGVSEGEVARWVNAYTIRENWKGPLPQDFRDRGSELIFTAAFPSSKIDGIMRCAFGRPTPPPDVPA